MPYKYPHIDAAEITHELKSFNEVANVNNNDKILYIKDGKLTCDTYSNIFTINSFDEDED